MKKLTLIAFVFFMASLNAQTTGQKNFIDQNYIEVTGKAEMQIVPDMIYLSIVINENDVKKSISEKEEQMIKALKLLGVDVSKNLKVEDLDSRFKSKTFKKDIVLSKSYQLLVNNADIAAQVFEKLEEIGISNVSIVKVDHSKIEQYRREVKVNATKIAKEKASDLAQAVGQIIGRALYIVEQNNYQNFSANSNTILYKSEQFNDVSDVDLLGFKNIKIEYSVLCCFELK